MKSIRNTLIATALMAGLTGLALAHSPHAPGDTPRVGRTEKMREHSAEHHAQHLATLKSKLNLQAAQEPAWNRFTQSMQHGARLARPERASLEKMTTPERLDQMQAMKAERDAHMQQRTEATRALYAALNAEQKQVFDQQTTRTMGFGLHAMRHHGGQGHH